MSPLLQSNHYYIVWKNLFLAEFPKELLETAAFPSVSVLRKLEKTVHSWFGEH